MKLKDAEQAREILDSCDYVNKLLFAIKREKAERISDIKIMRLLDANGNILLETNDSDFEYFDLIVESIEKTLIELKKDLEEGLELI